MIIIINVMVIISGRHLEHKNQRHLDLKLQYPALVILILEMQGI